MRKFLFLSLCSLFVLAACGAAPVASAAPSEPAASTAASATPQPVSTAAPSPTPSPFGASAPLLAVVVHAGEGQALQLIDLASEEVLAALPLSFVDEPRLAGVQFSSDESQLLYTPDLQHIVLYDIASGESRSIDLMSRVDGDQAMGTIAWSPSMQWISLETWRNNGNSV